MSVLNNYKKLIQNIKATCKECNRNYEKINIVAVSKQQEYKKIKSLTEAGHSCFGENRLDEAVFKWSKIAREKTRLHFIGALQSKKIKDIVKNFDVIETLDTESSAQKLALFKSRNVKIPEIYIQINIGQENQKRGINPSEVTQFLNICKNKYDLTISGAMCMPPINKNPKKYFKDMLAICTKEKLEKISMGMSNDFKEAIMCGTNNIRIGSLLFGEREKT